MKVKKNENTHSRQEAELKLNLQVQRNIQADEEHSGGTAAYQMHLDRCVLDAGSAHETANALPFNEPNM